MTKSRDFARDFLARHYAEGEVVPTRIFWEIFGLEEPRGVGEWKEFSKKALAFATCMERLKRDLLSHGHDLENIRTVGYRLIPYQERPAAVVSTCDKALKRWMHAADSRLNAIPHPEQLTGEAKYIRDSALLKYGHLRAIMKVK